LAAAADQVVPGSNAEFLHERLPNAQVDLIAGAGHFCWKEKPAEYAALQICVGVKRNSRWT
jgi:pimeloyl-ACP methyl ester carboxylesterase